MASTSAPGQQVPESFQLHMGRLHPDSELRRMFGSRLAALDQEDDDPGVFRVQGLGFGRGLWGRGGGGLLQLAGAGRERGRHCWMPETGGEWSGQGEKCLQVMGVH